MDTQDNTDILDLLPWALLRLDPEQKIVFINSAAQEIFCQKGHETVNFLSDIHWFNQYGKPLAPENHPINRSLNTGDDISKVILGFCLAYDRQITWIESYTIHEIKEGQG